MVLVSRQAASIRPMCENAWGKLPSCSPVRGSICSARGPRSLARPASSSNIAMARSRSPAKARH